MLPSVVGQIGLSERGIGGHSIPDRDGPEPAWNGGYAPHHRFVEASGTAPAGKSASRGLSQWLVVQFASPPSCTREALAGGFGGLFAEYQRHRLLTLRRSRTAPKAVPAPRQPLCEKTRRRRSWCPDTPEKKPADKGARCARARYTTGVDHRTNLGGDRADGAPIRRHRQCRARPCAKASDRHQDDSGGKNAGAAFLASACLGLGSCSITKPRQCHAGPSHTGGIVRWPESPTVA
jgi:hypothetical protein